MAVEVTTEKALRNAVASMKMEGLQCTQEEIDRVRDALEKHLTLAEFVQIVLNSLE
ncbi:MAG: hypothetical protein NC489_10830 [Ruminococcus flavefaciens]|nr:hypothetical protein [Ruminococcus flavefaciens]